MLAVSHQQQMRRTPRSNPTYMLSNRYPTLKKTADSQAPIVSDVAATHRGLNRQPLFDCHSVVEEGEGQHNGNVDLWCPLEKGPIARLDGAWVASFALGCFCLTAG